MARLCQALTLLMVTVALESSMVQAWHSPKVVRPFQDISPTYVYVQQAVWHAMKEYNKASEDKYSFGVVEILKSQEQVGELAPPSFPFCPRQAGPVSSGGYCR